MRSSPTPPPARPGRKPGTAYAEYEQRETEGEQAAATYAAALRFLRARACARRNAGQQEHAGQSRVDVHAVCR